MKKLIKALLLTLFITAFHSAGYARTRVYNASNIDEINKTLLALLEHQDPSRALLILPLELLIQPQQPGFYFDANDAQTLVKKELNKIPSNKKVYIEEFILTSYPQKIAENAVNFIDNMQKYNLPIIVSTENLAGSINDIRYLEVWTWNYLYEKGIDLSKTPMGIKEIKITSGTKKISGSYPTFFRGLLSCNNYNSSNKPQIVLASLLATKLRWLPSTVYAIDKDEAYLKSLEKQFATLRPDIQFEGFVYRPVHQKEEYNQLSSQDLRKFWQELAAGVGKIRRIELKSATGDPYEE